MNRTEIDSPDPILSSFRFLEKIISQCVWLYFNFAVSFRDVELMMAFRGVQLSYETIRRWCERLGPSYAAKTALVVGWRQLS